MRNSLCLLSLFFPGANNYAFCMSVRAPPKSPLLSTSWGTRLGLNPIFLSHVSRFIALSPELKAFSPVMISEKENALFWFCKGVFASASWIIRSTLPIFVWNEFAGLLYPPLVGTKRWKIIPKKAITEFLGNKIIQGGFFTVPPKRLFGNSDTEGFIKKSDK